ncbi:transcription elongation factor A N-terminal and central domain-containing protein 2-like [Biomphalaria glabrata]|uniref:Transcription elongation factor A N-terminal and central domain-containing protein 2-like n=1 Tax=Biomphalaria glabrata TaxID=6526 RepID=A0A9W3AFJ0_BIOGL|nr:transcription elongation factor A N-terminal and central domain-containing protein 2-like [Biomphalaria glabrata]
MDRYLIKTKRKKEDKEIRHIPSTSGLKQSTIHSLKRVVVVEDIKRLKSKLVLPNQSKSVMIESLKALGMKIPSKEVLQSTKIGHTVKRLKQHSDEDIAREAKRVYIKWKDFFLEGKNRPPIEVKCDKKSETFRSKGKALLAESLTVEEDHVLVDAIERETFHQHKQLFSSEYRRTLRTIVLKLKHNPDLRQKVLDGQISVEMLVKDFKKR